MPRSDEDLAQNAVKAFVIVPGGPSSPLNNETAAKEVRVRPGSLAPDHRRKTAQIAAKVRWANWASKKAL